RTHSTRKVYRIPEEEVIQLRAGADEVVRAHLDQVVIYSRYLLDMWYPNDFPKVWTAIKNGLEGMSPHDPRLAFDATVAVARWAKAHAEGFDSYPDHLIGKRLALRFAEEAESSLREKVTAMGWRAHPSLRGAYFG
ncbi:MAG TPA: hypothetical protein VHB73_07590, partial [Alphaproteobacteria bacterium]|nr:hypothetical protein [Alphaproteobacteria bacterium]